MNPDDYGAIVSNLADGIADYFDDHAVPFGIAVDALITAIIDEFRFEGADDADAYNVVSGIIEGMESLGLDCHIPTDDGFDTDPGSSDDPEVREHVCHGCGCCTVHECGDVTDRELDADFDDLEEK